MTTALQIITDAAAEFGVSATGQTLGPEDSALMLRQLNRRLQSLSNSRLMFPALVDVSIPLTGSQSYTVGPTGGITATRPLRIESATAVASDGLESPVVVMNSQQWSAIGFKGTTDGPPSAVFYDAQNTTGVVYVNPRASGYTLKLRCTSLLSSFDTLTTDCVLPDGYELALLLTLAEDSAGTFGKQITQDLRMRARGARSVVKRTNTEPLYLRLDSTASSYGTFTTDGNGEIALDFSNAANSNYIGLYSIGVI